MRTSLGAVAIVLAGAACTSSPDPNETFEPHCFVRGTRVRTPSGTKAIEEIVEGDSVLAFDPSTMAIAVRRVTAVHVASARRIHTIDVGGRRVTTTEAHPFWEAEKRTWVHAADLACGNVLALFEDGRLVPHTIDAVGELARDVEVFNLTVEGPEHTYFAEDIAVHNKSVMPCCPPPDSPTGPGITIENDSNEDLAIGSLTPPQATIDQRVLTRKLDIELPASVFDKPLLRQTVAPQSTVPVSGPINVVAPSGNLIPQTGVFIEVGGETALYVGEGLLRTRFVDGVLTLVPEDSSKIKVVHLSKTAPICADAASPLVYESLVTADLNASFTIAEATRDAGCTTVKLTPKSAAVAAREIRFCAPEDAWPFATGDEVQLGYPTMLVASLLGLRLQRADGAAFEVTLIDNPEVPPFDAKNLTLTEDTSCVLPIDQTTACRQVRLRATTSGSIDVAGARAWVVGATSTALMLDCAAPSTKRIAVVARSNP